MRRILLSISYLMVLIIAFLLIVFNLYRFKKEHRIQNQVAKSCITDKSYDYGKESESIRYSFREMNVTDIAFIFLPNGKIFIESKNGEKVLCTLTKEQPPSNYIDLKELILGRYKESENNSTDTPIFGERINLQLVSKDLETNIDIGFNCHVLSKDFKKIRKEILKIVDKKMDYHSS